MHLFLVFQRGCGMVCSNEWVYVLFLLFFGLGVGVGVGVCVCVCRYVCGCVKERA